MQAHLIGWSGHRPEHSDAVLETAYARPKAGLKWCFADYFPVNLRMYFSKPASCCLIRSTAP